MISLAGSTFLRVTAATAALTGVAFVLAAVTIARQGNASKPLGWTAIGGDSGWVVASIDTGGPAAGRLQPGDRLQTIDGDSAVRSIGPTWILRDAPTKSGYDVGVLRGGQSVQVSVPWPVRQEPWLAFWRWMYLAIGLVYLTTGLLIAYAKPESDVARRAVYSAVLAAIFFIGAALNASAGMLSGVPLVLAAATFLVRPFHLVTGYRFNSAFPVGAPSTGGWRVFEWIMYPAAVLLWVPMAAVAMLRSLGPDRASDIVARYAPGLQDAFVDSVMLLLAGVLAVANALVIWRNYRLVAEEELRRRIRWVMMGVGAGLLPIVVVVPFIVSGYAAGNREQFVSVIRIVNLFTVIGPLCIAYAVIRHRVLGVRMVVRTGVQYLLAKNVLRLALAVPLVLIVASLVTNPDAALFELGTGNGRWRLALIVLAATALLYRRQMLDAIDRRFFREAYRQDQIFATLADAIGRAAHVKELSRLLSSQIQDALHPRRIVAVAREGRDEFALLFSSSGESNARAFGDFNLAPHSFEDVEAATVVSTLTAIIAAERAMLTALDIHLVVPIRGPNEGLVGLLLLGEKMSEEPYTTHDRRMLDTIAAQTGVVWENVKLRERLGREQAVRRELLARADGSADVLYECPACAACYDGSVATCADDGRELSPSLPIPKVLDGKYDLRRLIGRGGMGAVYEATDLRLERTVAVKVATGAMFGDAVALQRFGREARASAKLDHPNVVRAYDYGEVHNGAYLVLEHLRGENLRALIGRRGTLGARETARILTGVFEGVTAAHDQGVVHRDIKPENVFLVQSSSDSESIPKILDFGLAAVRDLGFANADKLTQTGAAVGTLAYMSAEQFLGDRVDERADVYALGVLTLEMLTGELPSRGPTFSRIAAIVDERLGVSASAEARQVGRVVRRAVAERAEDRYETVRAFAAELLPALTGETPAFTP